MNMRHEKNQWYLDDLNKQSFENLKWQLHKSNSRKNSPQIWFSLKNISQFNHYTFVIVTLALLLTLIFFEKRKKMPYRRVISVGVPCVNRGITYDVILTDQGLKVIKKHTKYDRNGQTILNVFTKASENSSVLVKSR